MEIEATEKLKVISAQDVQSPEMSLTWEGTEHFAYWNFLVHGGISRAVGDDFRLLYNHNHKICYGYLFPCKKGLIGLIRV